jgi:hypothetical protein
LFLHELVMEREGVNIGEGPSEPNDDLSAPIAPVHAGVLLQARS